MFCVFDCTYFRPLLARSSARLNRFGSETFCSILGGKLFEPEGTEDFERIQDITDGFRSERNIFVS